MIRAFLKSRDGKIGIAIVGVLLIAAIVGPPLLSGPASQLHFDALNLSPSMHHWLGTDTLGRDRLARLVVASRLSIVLALEATLLGAGIGIVWGAGTALLPGHLRSIGLRLIDALMAFPAVLVAIFIGAILGASANSAMIGVAVGLSVPFARVTSNLALSLTAREYVQAARMTGVRGPQLIFRHILPNAGETLAITATVTMSASIVALATLSFLGLGVQSPQYDWGDLLTQGVQQIYESPAAAFGPAVAIAVVALAFGFLGEALARSMNPARWRADRGAGASPTIPAKAASNGAHRPAAQVAQRPAAPVTSGLDLQTASAVTAVATRRDQVLEVENLTVSFPGTNSTLHLVNGISFSVARGEMIGIAGESGSGKTMTAMAVAGLIPHPGRVTGTVRLAGCELTTASSQERRNALVKNLAVVFQDPMSSLNPALTIGRQMTEAVEVHGNMPHREALALAEQRLAELNIPAPALQLSRYPHELSGGMRQRVMIAMGLMNTPPLLIADEPTTSLDLTVQAQLMELFHKVSEEHDMAVLLISHNLGLLSQNCSRVITMYAGGIVEDGPTEDVLLDPLHPYTRALLAVAPKLDHPRGDRLASIPGQPPDVNSLPLGCAFHPRCPVALDRCKVEMPPLVGRAHGRHVSCWVANEGVN
jgi:oligopeptide/dipeptide ABC transporter ATP-binding protein